MEMMFPELLLVPPGCSSALAQQGLCLRGKEIPGWVFHELKGLKRILWIVLEMSALKRPPLAASPFPSQPP